jgi:hypothetical protein
LNEWLAGDGRVLAVREEDATAGFASPRRKGSRRGAKLMFLSGVLMPVFFGLCFLVDNPAPLFIPLTIFLAGLSLMLYCRIFSEDISRSKSQPAHPSRLGAMFGGTALPPASNIGMNSVSGQPVRTAELAQPPSVTEHTTKLLDHD